MNDIFKQSYNCTEVVHNFKNIDQLASISQHKLIFTHKFNFDSNNRSIVRLFEYNISICLYNKNISQSNYSLI